MDSFFTFIVGLFTAVLSFFGFVQVHLELPQPSRDQAVEVVGEASNVIVGSESNTDVPTSWKTYTDTEYGLTFRYPPNFVITEQNSDNTIVRLNNKDQKLTWDANEGITVSRDIGIFCGIGNVRSSREDLIDTGWGGTMGGEARAVCFRTKGVAIEVSRMALTTKNTGDRILNSFQFISVNTQPTVSVPGMSKYTDADFGFSFWYPSSWKVVARGDSIQLYDSQGKDTGLGITKKNLSDGRLFLSGHACGPAGGCADLTYYFDSAMHTWMQQHGTGVPVPADVSTNTMGGLHMLNGNVRFGLSTIVPLSAHHFLDVRAAPAGIGGGFYGTDDYLARTILTTDPSVATPVSVAEQIKVIQAERDAYAGR